MNDKIDDILAGVRANIRRLQKLGHRFETPPDQSRTLKIYQHALTLAQIQGDIARELAHILRDLETLRQASKQEASLAPPTDAPDARGATTEANKVAPHIVSCSVREAARRLGVSETTVLRRVKTGILPAERVGKRWQILLTVEVAPESILSKQARQVLEEPMSGAGADAGADTGAYEREPDFDEAEVARLLDASLTALQHGQLAQAEQLLAEAVHRKPGDTTARRQPVKTKTYIVPQAWQSRSALEKGTLIVAVLALCGLFFLLPALLNRLGALAQSDNEYQSVVSSTPVFTESLRVLTPLHPVQTTPSPQVTPVSPQVATGSASRSSETTPQAPPVQPTLPIHTSITSTPASAIASLLKRLSASERELRSGRFDAVSEYSGANHSSVRVSFDLGGEDKAPRFHITTTYRSSKPKGEHTVERIAIGDRAWQRQSDGEWTRAQEQEGAWGQVQTYLPHIEAVGNVKSTRDGESAKLRWYDAGRDADVTLTVNASTGVPKELRQVSRVDGSILDVTYIGWNTPVEITPPDQ